MSDVPAPFIAAAVQASPVFLDCEETISKAHRLIGEAAAQGAKLVVFPEAFVPGYPYWMWGDRPTGIDNFEGNAFSALWQAAIDVPGPATSRLGEAAREHSVHLVIGANERESVYGRATLYNSQLTFGPNGTMLGCHRKLVPTYKERTIWGQGDGSTLQVYQTQIGRLGGLICWENYMPLARFHQYAQGVQVYAALTADAGDAWTNLVRAIAAEGKTFVVSVCQFFDRTDFPDEVFLSGFAPGDDVLSTGGSMIIAPNGDVLAGPLRNEEGILTAEIDLTRVIQEKHSLDVVGHYGRPDIFQLTVNDRPAIPFQHQPS